MIEYRNEIYVGLVICCFYVCKDALAFDPAFRNGEIISFAELPCEEIGVIWEVPVIHGNRRNVPIFAGLQREFLCGDRN